MISLRRIARFIYPYRWLLIIGFFTVIVPVAMELAVPRLLQYIIDQGIHAEDMSVVTRGALIMLGAAFTSALMTVAQGYCRAQISQGLAFDMRNELFRHIQSFSFANLDQMQTGQLITRVSSDVDTVRMFSSAGLALLLRTSLMVIGSIIMLVVTDWRLSLIMFLILAIAAVLLVNILRIARPLFSVVQQRLGKLNTIVQENLAGVQVVKAFVREHFENNRFGQANKAYMDENIRVGQLLAVAMPALLILTNLGVAAMLWWGGYGVITARLTIGQLVAFNNYLMIGMGPLLFLSNLLNMVSRADASAERILEVFDTQPKIQRADKAHQAATIRGQVTFNNVSFQYDAAGRAGVELSATPGDSNGTAPAHVVANGDGTPENVLVDVSLRVEPGQQIALLGATGSGKTTLVNLLPRFYDVTRGHITIDGVDIRHWDPAALRAQIGIVLQQNTLFSGTIRDNVAYGAPDASVEQVMAAAQAAQAHDFIMQMPDGYDSMVEARGANLSGGQKQRIAIARAILIQPSILIFDDSTSAVDLETEFKIQAALDQLMENCTSFIVAQRINSVLNADQILVLDRGRISASGTHAELMQSSTIYQEIYQSQLGER